MNVAWIFLLVFFLVGVVHLAAIALGKERLRCISKVLIVPVILAGYIAATGKPSVLLVLALILGWLGDVLLIKIDQKICFMSGLAAFLLGHVCYIVAFIWLLGFFGAGQMNIVAMAIGVPLAVVAGVLLLRFVRPPNDMLIPVIVYTVAIMAMALWALQVFLFNANVAGFLILAGSLCFVCSDSILAYCTFREMTKKGSFSLMALYMLAQATIVTGIFLLTTGVGT